MFFLKSLAFAEQVKLVLAAAMWSNPHMLVLDEPTNYLDRESLGALAQAIKDWSGEQMHTQYLYAKTCCTAEPSNYRLHGHQDYIRYTSYF